MPTNKSQRKYHADGFTYDERKKAYTLLNAEDKSRKDLIKSTLAIGGVGPETIEMNKIRMGKRNDYLYKNKSERYTASGDKVANKARGTQSSSTRKLIK